MFFLSVSQVTDPYCFYLTFLLSNTTLPYYVSWYLHDSPVLKTFIKVESPPVISNVLAFKKEFTNKTYIYSLCSLNKLTRISSHTDHFSIFFFLQNIKCLILCKFYWIGYTHNQVSFIWKMKLVWIFSILVHVNYHDCHLYQKCQQWVEFC